MYSLVGTWFWAIFSGKWQWFDLRPVLGLVVFFQNAASLLPSLTHWNKSIINIISDKKNNSSTKRRGSADLELGNFRGTTPVTPSTFSSDKRPKMRRRISNDDLKSSGSGQSDTYTESVKSRQSIFACRVPFLHWLFLGFLRSIDLGLTNASLRYVNYPVKTLLKSSRVIFTMIAGIFVMKKKVSEVEMPPVGGSKVTDGSASRIILRL